MKIVICGSRYIKKLVYVKAAMEEAKLLPAFNRPMTEIISGGANGVDKLGEEYADFAKLDLVIFPANWNRYGKAAGFKRNLQMLERADGVVAVWDGVSRGTAHTIEEARKRGMPLHVKIVKDHK